MHKLALLLLVATAACAPRLPRSTLPAEYACLDASIVVRGNRLEIRDHTASLAAAAASAETASLAHRDDDGDHFVSRVGAEYVVPADPHQDASERVYDAATANRRLVRSGACVARGGYSAALARYVEGETFDQVAHDFALADRDAARDLVHHAMLTLARRYYGDR